MATAHSDRVRILLVEDDEDDYLITRELLAGQPRVQFELDWCADFDDALALIGACVHDAYLIDYRLGAQTGLELVKRAFGAPTFAPVIMLTGQADYAIDLEATALGITDYLVKQELTSVVLERSLRYAISHQKAVHDLARSEERYALAVRAANDGIWDWDLDGDRMYFSPRWHALLGQPEHTHSEDPESWFGLVHPGDRARLQSAVAQHLGGRTPHLQSEHRIRHADGSWRWVSARGLAIRDPQGHPSRMAGSLSDITDRRAAQQRLKHDALHDTLTGLPNRTLLLDRLGQILQRTARDPVVGCAVLFMDIDRFKLVNDSLSHAVGDGLLVALSGRLAARAATRGYRRPPRGR